MISSYLIVLVPIALSLAITPLVISYARRIGAIDLPNERKVHRNPIPRLGGVAIYISFLLSYALAIWIDPDLNVLPGLGGPNGVVLVASLTLVLLLGIWDDIRPLTPGRKFLGQILAASIVYFAGFRITAVTHPLGPSLLSLDWFAFPLTILWIVGITNAFNLIDGLDGLASGVAFIVSVTIFSIALVREDTATAMMALLLAGSLLGFLRYNFRGARIFLGDSGSLFIGFSLAILSMQSSTKGSTAFSILVPVLALGLPIMDTVLSMIRRLIKSVLPQSRPSSSLMGRITSMFHPDKGHVHHQLVAMGFSHRKAVIVLYMVSCLFGVGAFAVTFANSFTSSLIITSIAIATFVGVSQLRYREMAILRNGLFLPMYEWPIMKNRLVLGFLDLGFIVAAYLASYKLAFRGETVFASDRLFFVSLSLVSGIQMLVLYFSGIYRSMVRQLGLGDMLKLVKGVTVTVAVTFFALLLIPGQRPVADATFILLDFFILLALVLTARSSFRILDYFSRKEFRAGCRRVLIYGADSGGQLLLNRFLGDAGLRYCPAGFLDDNPDLEGKRLDGYPIYGGHWRVERLVRTEQIEEIIIATDVILPAALERLQRTCRDLGIVLRRSKVNLELCDPVIDRRPAERVPAQESFSFTPR